MRSLRGLFAILVTVLVAFGSGSANAQRGDPNLGRNLAATCASCHSTSSDIGGIPSLGGQRKEELVRKLQQFKTGAVPSTVMQQLAKGYTDEQIDELAAWLAAR